MVVKETSRNDGEAIETSDAALSKERGHDIPDRATNSVRGKDLHDIR